MCEAIRADWDAYLTSLDGACEVDGDCVVLGESGGCEGGTASIGPCMGTAVNQEAYEARRAEASAILARWDDCQYVDCYEGADCSVDCGFGRPSCNAGRCEAQEYGCIGPIDAGADASPVDAGP